MKGPMLVGALALSFALGGVTTLLGLPRISPATTGGATVTSADILSPGELMRAATPPEDPAILDIQ